MKIFVDIWHYELWKSIYYTLYKRLGHQLFVLNNVAEFQARYPTFTGFEIPMHEFRDVNFIDMQALGDIDFDIIMATTAQNCTSFQDMKRDTNKHAALILFHAEEYQDTLMCVDWDQWEGFISPTPVQVINAPQKNRTCAILDFGVHQYREYQQLPKQPTIGCFIRELSSFTFDPNECKEIKADGYLRKCFYCGCTGDQQFVDTQALWDLLCDTYKPIAYFVTGLPNRKHYARWGIGNIPEGKIPGLHMRCWATWHYRPCGGHEFGILESLASGRPIITDWTWWTPQTPGMFLRLNLNLLHSPPNVDDMIYVLKEWVSKDRNDDCKRIHSIFHNSIDFNYEAKKIEAVLQNTL